MIRPLGVYGSKDEIVRLLRSIGAIDEDVWVSPPVYISLLLRQPFSARWLLEPADVGGSKPYLSSGLYIVRANATINVPDERHYVIFWPEDSTWNDSATSSVRRNRVTFMR
jgi:hypothetical protein